MVGLVAQSNNNNLPPAKIEIYQTNLISNMCLRLDNLIPMMPDKFDFSCQCSTGKHEENPRSRGLLSSVKSRQKESCLDRTSRQNHPFMNCKSFHVTNHTTSFFFLFFTRITNSVMVAGEPSFKRYLGLVTCEPFCFLIVVEYRLWTHTDPKWCRLSVLDSKNDTTRRSWRIFMSTSAIYFLIYFCILFYSYQG